MKDKRCIDYRKAIRESAKHLFVLERKQSKALLRDRSAEKLWKKYCQEGLQGLLIYPYKGRKAQ